MKDYTLDSEEAVSFILNYEIKDNQIIVNYANGEHYIIPYTNDNEEKILKKMEDQVYSAQYYDELSKKILKKSRNWILFCILMIILLKTNSSFIPLMQNILIGSCTLCIGWKILYIKYIKANINDLE